MEYRLDPVNTRERLVSFFKNQTLVDCTFIFGIKKVRAHKLILACSSPVFERMFFGEMAQDTVEIIDICFQDFNQVLGFIYGLEGVEISSIANAWNLFYIASKYLLDDLRNVCLSYINNNLSMSTIALSYEYSEAYDLFDIKEKCFENMVNYFSGIFYCDYHIKSSTLCKILEQIIRPDINLLINIIKWGKTACENKQIQILPNNILKLLEEENILRYFKKEYLDFKQIQQVEVIMVKEVLLLLVDCLDWSKEPCDFTVSHLKTPPFCRFRIEYKIAVRLDLAESEHFVSTFSVDKRIFIFGIVINTPLEPNDTPKKLFYDGKIVVKIQNHKSQKDVVTPMKFKQAIPYSMSDFYLSFYNLAVFEPDNIYKIKISFTSVNNKGYTSLHCLYMTNKLLNETKSTCLNFFEMNGTIIKGVSFYPE